MDTNMIHINRIWWEIANTIRLSHFISSGVTPYTEEQLMLVVMRNGWEVVDACLPCKGRAGSQGTLEHSGSHARFLSPTSCSLLLHDTFGLGQEFFLHSQTVLPELWSLKYHVTWFCLGGPRSDKLIFHDPFCGRCWQGGDSGREMSLGAHPNTL